MQCEESTQVKVKNIEKKSAKLENYIIRKIFQPLDSSLFSKSYSTTDKRN